MEACRVHGGVGQGRACVRGEGGDARVSLSLGVMMDGVEDVRGGTCAVVVERALHLRTSPHRSELRRKSPAQSV